MKDPIARRTCALCIFILLIALVAPGSLRSQHQDDMWIFGNGLGIGFGGGKPVLIQGAAIDARYTPSASVSDRATGALLFYTNGYAVWNGAHDTIPGGRLFGDTMSPIEVIVVPDPGNESRYYLFTSIYHSGTEGVDAVYYAVVDMREGGGRGAVISKNNLLMRAIREIRFDEVYIPPPLTAIAHCNGRDFWLVTSHSAYDGDPAPTPGIASYLISPAGIATKPVVTHDPAMDSGGEYRLAASPDGGYLLAGRYSWVTGDSSWLFRFDRASGRIARIMTFRAVAGAIGDPMRAYTCATFSPDGSRLYIGWVDLPHRRTRGILQYDLCLPDSGAIAASSLDVKVDSTEVDVGYFFEGFPIDVQLAPDGRIYVGYENVAWLDAIDRPDERGTACAVIDSAVNLNGIHPSYPVNFRRLPTRITAWPSPNFPCGYRRVCLAHHTIHQCAGTSGRTIVEYHHEDQVDTAISVRFIGDYAANMELDIPLPFALPPTETIQIPVRHRWMKAGTFATRMQIGTAAGFTYEIMVISHIDSTITRVLGVDTIHIGSHDGAFDTCVAIPNVGPLGLQLSEAIWSKGDGTFAMTFPKMPSHIAAGGSFRFCLYTVDARGNASTRLLLGGEMVDTFGIAHCVAHELVIDTKPPSDPVSSAPAPGTGGASMASITAYPNPFHAGLTVEIASPSRRHARVYAVDALGREVALLRDGMLDAGVTRLALDGAGLASGVYVIRCEMEGRMATRAVVVCR